ncbi:MAG: type II toxin-antitoxin system VapC family toxin [Bacteroidota bacterium]
MIVLDTHVWIWWVTGNDRLTESQKEALREGEQDGIGVSVISCWEVAKLVEIRRLDLDRPIAEWLRLALSLSGVRLLDLTPEIAVASTTLPGDFHRDPADQIIVATARSAGCPLVTSDRQIIAYEHVETIA